MHLVLADGHCYLLGGVTALDRATSAYIGGLPVTRNSGRNHKERESENEERESTREHYWTGVWKVELRLVRLQNLPVALHLLYISQIYFFYACWLHVRHGNSIEDNIGTTQLYASVSVVVSKIISQQEIALVPIPELEAMI